MQHVNGAISIVIPVHNIERFVGECILSVIAQTHERWHCYIIDDGSTDGSVQQARQFVDSRLTLVTQGNRGVSAARNAGLALAKTPLIMFLDGDDRLHPTALARLSTRLADDPRYVAVFGTMLKILEEGGIAPQQKPLHLHRYPSGDVLAPMLRENFLANGGHVLVRTETARKVGGFDEQLKLSEDWEFWCRLAAEGPFGFIDPEPEVFYLRLRRGSSSSRSQDWEEHRPSLEKVFGNESLRARFSSRYWQELVKQAYASHMWEAGRVNFTSRRHRQARRLMIRSLKADFRLKRAALLGIAQLSRVLNVSLTSRLRFKDHDDRESSVAAKRG